MMKAYWEQFKGLEKESLRIGKDIVKNPWYWIISAGAVALSWTPYLVVKIKEDIEWKRQRRKMREEEA